MIRYLDVSRLVLLVLALAASPHAAPSEAQSDSAYREAQSLSNEGRAREAAEAFRRAHALRVQALGEDHSKTVAALASYGEHLRRAGDPRQALTILTEAVERGTRAWGPHDASLLATLNNLALAHYESGDLAQALQRQENLVSLTTERLGPSHADTLGRTLNLAVMMGEAGRRQDAAQLLASLLGRTRAALGPNHRLTLSVTSHYIGAMTQLGQAAAMEPLKRRNLEAAAAVYGPQHSFTLAERSGLGRVLLELKRYPEAIDTLREALDQQTAALGAAHTTTVQTMNLLASAYYETRDNARASELYRRSLAAEEGARGPMTSGTLSLLHNVAAISARSGDMGDTIKYRAELIRRVEALRESGFSPDYRRALMQRWAPSYKEYAAILARSSLNDESFRIAELTKARTLQELSAVRNAVTAGLMTPQERERVTALEARIAVLDARIASLAGQPQQRVAVESDKETAVRELTREVKALETRYPKLAELGEARVPLVAELRGLLPPDATYVSYLVQHNLFAVIVVSPEHGLHIRRPGLIPNLSQTIAAYRYLLAVPPELRARQAEWPAVWRLDDGSFRVAALAPAAGARKVDDENEIAAYLGDKFLGPVAKQLAGARRLIVSPDADLAYVPFEALRIGGEYVVERYDVQYTQSAGMYVLSRGRADEYAKLDGRAELLAVGGAVYEQYMQHSPLINMHADLLAPAGALPASDKTDVPQAFQRLKIAWKNLPGTEREATRVAALYTGSRTRLLKGVDASEQRLWELHRSGELAGYRNILFAAHGYLSPHEPRLSSVVLSQFGNRGPYDGYITAAEWPLYDLRSDLVVLSACNTALGPVANGEGVLGLPFALHVAGNRNTVMTLWAVNDQSTADFIEQFFSRIRGGADHARALSETKRAFLKQGRWRDARFWAPFVLYGS